jgi:hypothetical protein
MCLQPLNFFCRTCEEVACSNCIVISHRDATHQ